MAEKYTLNEVVQMALLNMTDQLGPATTRYMPLRHKVNNPDKVIEALYKIIAELHTVNKRVTRPPQVPKYWPEAAKKHPTEFPQFIQNCALNGAHSGDSMREGELEGAVSALLTQVYQMRGMFDDEDGAIQGAVAEGEEALGVNYGK